MGVVFLCVALFMGAVRLTVNSFRSAAVQGKAPQTADETQASGGESAFREISRNKKEGVFVPIIMYHGLLEDDLRQGDYVVKPENFISDMEFLIANGYTSVFVSELIDYAENGTPLPEKPVVITFDDGHYNVMHYAYPYMKEHGIKGVMSVVGSYTERAAEEDEHNPNYSALTWDEIRTLHQSGVFEIGNHTYDMHSLDCRKGSLKLLGESDEEYQRVLTEDIGRLQGLLTDKADVTPVIFTYPFGFVSDESVEILAKMGFKALLTCYEKPNYITHVQGDFSLMSLNRYNRPSGVTTEEFMKRLLSE